VPPPLGLYCHVPFCADTCDFCAFYQQPPKRDDITRFLDGVGRELGLAPPDRAADTFFWGGGTPGILAPDALTRLAAEFVRANGGALPAEWTVELSPATADARRLAALRAAGVTRISLGVQSFDPATLAALGRHYNPAQIFAAWERIRAANFRDTSLDLIFAAPGQDEARWRRDLETAVSLAPDHISTYCLTLEEDAALYLRLARAAGAPPRPDAEREAALYRETWAFLEGAGYAQYEVSNFARRGRECRHNLNTWRMAEWLGYGPAAASQSGGRRFQNPADLDRWLANIDTAAGVTGTGAIAREQVVELTPELLLQDALVFGLRMNAGVSLTDAERRFGACYPAALRELGERLAAEGLLEITAAGTTGDAATGDAGDLWRLTLEGRLRADAVALAVLEAF
jgi:oxygen-independent coproporphyrinogen-3 oxidase